MKKYNEMPRIRIELEGYSEKLCAVIMTRHEDIEEVVKKGVDEAILHIEEYLIEQVKEVALQTAGDAVKSYFTFGNGRGVIHKMVEEAFDRSSLIREEVESDVVDSEEVANDNS